LDAPEDLVAFCGEQQPRLVGMLTLYCGNVELAEELAQEALARTCNRWRKVRQMDSPGGWVYRVAINLANSHFRRKAAERRAHERLRSAPDPGGIDPDIAASVAVMGAVSQLPQRQRTALVLRYYADLPIAEVARLMDCPEGTVKTLTHKAARVLRDCLGRQEPSEVAHGS
jgi:RNA polymerase sigma-70 factor (ECF subfamily)